MFIKNDIKNLTNKINELQFYQEIANNKRVVKRKIRDLKKQLEILKR